MICSAAKGAIVRIRWLEAVGRITVSIERSVMHMIGCGGIPNAFLFQLLLRQVVASSHSKKGPHICHQQLVITMVGGNSYMQVER